MILDMCYLDVRLVHDSADLVTVEGPELADEVKYWDISNTQLDIDFKMTTGFEMEENVFTITIWNYPLNLELTEGDYLFVNWQWKSSPNEHSPEITGVVTKIVEDHSAADSKVVIDCDIAENFLFKTKMIQAEAPISTLAEYFALLEPVGIKEIQIQIPDVTMETKLKSIFVEDMTLLNIGRKFKQAIEEIYEINISWRIDNKETIVFYDPTQPLIQTDVLVPIINRDDIFKLQQTRLSSNSVKHNIYFEAFGIPTLEIGKFIQFDDELYLIEEIEHIIEADSGYNMKVYAYRNIQQVDEGTEVVTI